jgi:hypothetical protein
MHINKLVEAALEYRTLSNSRFMKYALEADTNLQRVHLIGYPQNHNGSEHYIVTIVFSEYNGKIEKHPIYHV